MAKAPDAFRTISEVSDALDTPAHVLRFWESKFSQIKPVKRAGGRRYYRPQDVSLLSGIKALLHEQGMTIKGAQKLLRDKGVKHVQALGADIETATPDAPAPKSEPPAQDTAQPKLEILKATASRAEGREKPARPVPELPPNPVMDTSMPARFFVSGQALDEKAMRAKARHIAPLLARLETVRDQMRQT